MSNPTSNFGWQMPTATDLVTDLPADFEVFGQAVDTDLADLNGGTTGQILSKTSATDLDFTWIDANSGDITGVTAGTGISGGGTSGTVTVTNSMATAITTSGDLVQGTGSGTFARLGTGTSGQYLTTNGTTNSWVTPPTAGGMTLISTTTLSGATTTLSSIPQTYKNLQVVVKNPDNSNNPGYCKLRMNGNGSSTNHLNNTTYGVRSDISNDDTSIDVLFNYNNTTTEGIGVVDIYDYTNSTTFTIGNSLSYSNNPTTATNYQIRVFSWVFAPLDPITSLEFRANVGTFTGGTVLLYGVS